MKTILLAALLISTFLCSFSEGSLPQSINLPSVGNARELGGYRSSNNQTVKHSTLLRTAALNKISSQDINTLTDTLNLATITDLRMTAEVSAKPDPKIDNVKYVNLHVIDEELFNQNLEKKLAIEGSAIERLKLTIDSGIISFDMYIKFFDMESGKKAYRQFFRELLELPEGKSLLFHCTQGKDRTGCAAMLILSALGVPEDVIMEDYMLTNEYNADLIASQHQWLLSNGIKESELEKYMLILDEVNPKTMNTTLSWLKENYGSPLGYIINELGITEAEIAELKSKFLEGEEK